eukprot:25251-Eustigmatos_ZCMA.PRE.1
MVECGLLSYRPNPRMTLAERAECRRKVPVYEATVHLDGGVYTLRTAGMYARRIQVRPSYLSIGGWGEGRGKD